MTTLVMLHLAFSATALPSMPSDTPPQLPVPVSALSNMKSARDVVAVTLLRDGSRAPAELALPELANQRHVLEFIRVNYPAAMRNGVKRNAIIAWLFVDDAGKPGAAELLTSSGHSSLDSLSLEVLKIALFRPALHDGKTVGVWFPFPAAIPHYDDLIKTLDAMGRPLAEVPSDVPYTQKPVLLNRNQVEAAILRMVNQLDPRVRQLNEAFERPQTAGGVTDVHVFIETDGSVQNAVVKKSSGNRDLDDAALNIVRMMRFAPARNDDKPVAVWIAVPIKFSRTNR